MVGNTSHCRPQSTTEMNHHQYSTTTNFVPHTDIILCALTVSLNRCGTHRQHTLCYLPISCTNVCRVSVLVFISTDMEWVVQCLPLFTAFSTLVTFFRLMTISDCPSHGMSIVHCLPFQHMRTQPPPLYFIHMQHYRRHICSQISADILLLKENQSMPSGHLDGFGICTPSLTLQTQRWIFKF